ncbi:MAG: hypothetical protein HY907_21230 [Deltaproteobacteria bacterium]|nr:hypothetical protein [Deltaproteobacteria bacterium]
MRYSIVDTVLVAGAVVLAGGAVGAAVVVAGGADCGGKSGDSRPETPQPSAVAWTGGGRGGGASSACSAADGPWPALALGATSACTVGSAETPIQTSFQTAEPTVGTAKDLDPGKLGQWAVCGVTGSTFLVGSGTPAVEVRGSVHTFCCDTCATRFLTGLLVASGEPVGGT